MAMPCSVGLAVLALLLGTVGVDAVTCSADVMAYYNQAVQPIVGGVWKDIGPLGNDGTVSGSVTTSGSEVVFSGGSVDTGITMGAVNAASGNGEYTVAAWFQYTGLTSDTYSAIFGGRDLSGGTDWFIGKHAGSAALGIQDGNYRSNFVAAPGIFDTTGRSTAHSIVFTRSGWSGSSYTGKVYIDGILKATGTFSGVNDGEQLTIGREYSGSSYSFTGKVWQAIILKKELSAADALGLHSILAAGQDYCQKTTPYKDCDNESEVPKVYSGVSLNTHCWNFTCVS